MEYKTSTEHAKNEFWKTKIKSVPRLPSFSKSWRDSCSKLTWAAPRMKALFHQYKTYFSLQLNKGCASSLPLIWKQKNMKSATRTLSGFLFVIEAGRGIDCTQPLANRRPSWNPHLRRRSPYRLMERMGFWLGIGFATREHWQDEDQPPGKEAVCKGSERSKKEWKASLESQTKQFWIKTKKFMYSSHESSEHSYS